MLKYFLGLKKPVFRFKKSKNEVLGLKKGDRCKESEKIIDTRVFSNVRGKKMSSTKKSQQKVWGKMR